MGGGGELGMALIAGLSTPWGLQFLLSAACMDWHGVASGGAGTAGCRPAQACRNAGCWPCHADFP